jgi:hypothetical protein
VGIRGSEPDDYLFAANYRMTDLRGAVARASSPTSMSGSSVAASGRTAQRALG